MYKAQASLFCQVATEKGQVLLNHFVVIIVYVLTTDILAHGIYSFYKNTLSDRRYIPPSHQGTTAYL